MRLLKRLRDGEAILALASIDGADERKRLPDAAIAALARHPLLLLPMCAMAEARQIEPSSASRIARALAAAGRRRAANRLVAATLVPFPADISLRRDRFRLLEELGGGRALLRFVDRVLETPTSDTELLWKIWRLVENDPPRQAVARGRFEEAIGGSARDLLLGARIARRSAEPALALARYEGAVIQHTLSREDRAEALHDGSELALATGLWPSAVTLIRFAVEGDVVDGDRPDVAAALAISARNPAPLAPMPLVLADDLLHAILPNLRRAQPGDGVLMVANGLACGGMERVLAVTTAGLFARRHPPEVALSSFEPDDPERSFFLQESALDPAKVHRLDRPAPVTAGTALLPPRWRSEAAALHDLVSHVRPAIIHAWNDRLGLVAALSAMSAGAGHLIIHLHHMRPTRDPNEAAAAASYPGLLKRLAGSPQVTLLFCAHAAARDYAEWLGLEDASRCKVIHNGFAVPPERDPGAREAARLRFGVPADTPVIVSLSRFEPVKQPLRWLDAAQAIVARVPNAYFIMAGDGELLAEARRHATRLGLARRVRFPGRISDTPSVLAAADLMMMASASEGLPNGAVEAQLAGVPLVAFDVGGVAETIIPQVTGRLVPANDIGALADAASSWLADPDALAATGRAARENAARRFGADRYMDALEQLYAEVAQ